MVCHQRREVRQIGIQCPTSFAFVLSMNHFTDIFSGGANPWFSKSLIFRQTSVIIIGSVGIDFASVDLFSPFIYS